MSARILPKQNKFTLILKLNLILILKSILTFSLMLKIKFKIKLKYFFIAQFFSIICFTQHALAWAPGTGFWNNTLQIFVGSLGSNGTADGTGNKARFNNSAGIRLDAAGNIYFADTNNQTIRKITPAGVVTTIAGIPGITGYGDGTGTGAMFYNPSGVGLDATATNLYVADTFNQVIRKITLSTGAVVTLSGTVQTTGYANGTSASTKFNYPTSVAVDSSGNVYVTDYFNNAIRKVTSTGTSSTLAGASTITAGTQTNGTGTAARFYQPTGIDIDSARLNLYVSDAFNNSIRKIVISSKVVTTFAGNPNSIAGSADGTGTLAFFNTPADIALDTAGNLYVPESTNQTLRKITSAGVVSTLAGSVGNSGYIDGVGTAARFMNPAAGGVDRSGTNVYLTDASNTFRKIVISSGSVSTFAGLLTQGTANGTGINAQFAVAMGIAVDTGGNFFVADNLNHTIRKVTSSGVVTTFAGRALSSGTADGIGTAAQFYWPFGIAIDSASNLIVSDTGNNKIRKITPSGNVTTLAGSGTAGYANGTGTAAMFYYPRGLAIDSNGYIYVAEAMNNLVRKISPAGVVSAFVGSTTASLADGVGTLAGFNYPSYIGIDNNGIGYVTDTGSSTIRKIIMSTGSVSTFAGSGLLPGNSNGTGAAARFSSPYFITTDSSHNVYVTDFTNNNVRKITPAGVTSTILGFGKLGVNLGPISSGALPGGPAGIIIYNGKFYMTSENAILTFPKP